MKEGKYRDIEYVVDLQLSEICRRKEEKCVYNSVTMNVMWSQRLLGGQK
jgi:hypothetical protein